MAVSKNNRKKGQKRQPMHARPVSEYEMRKEQQRKEAEAESARKSVRLNLLLTVGMLIGLVIAMCNVSRYGYVLTFACALGCLVTLSDDTKHRKLVTVCYLIYMLGTAFMFWSTR